MPIIESTTYPGPPRSQWNGHLQTIFPSVFRRFDPIPWRRERIDTPDDDFLDLDWCQHGNKKLAILTHGLEGHSRTPYILGMTQTLQQRNWDILAWNCRSCSGEMNRQFRLYHHGEIEDIATVIRYALELGYQEISLLGFSMGGNITLKYLGVHGDAVPKEIKRAVAMSSPCDLKAGVEILQARENWLYRWRFYYLLRRKVLQKAQQYPDKIDAGKLRQVRTWEDFDQLFSATIAGCDSAEAFYQQASSRNFISGIKRPTLILNAANDPILTERCSPKDLCSQLDHVFLEVTPQGGHLGFSLPGSKESWGEHRAASWIEQA